MKKLTSVVLSVLLVVSLFSCLLTGPVSATASSGELLTDGDFESAAINTSSGALGTLYGESINAFNADRSKYTGTWYRATGGNAPSAAPDLLEDQTSAGADDYPYYFGRNDQRIAEPGNADNHVMRAVQTLYQMVAVKENSSYSLSFRFKVPRAEATLDQKMLIGLLEPDVLNGTQISNINSPALPITSATVSGTNGLSAYIIPDNFAGDKGSIQLSFDGSNSEWQNVTLNFTTGSFYSDALAEEYGDEHLIVLNFSWSVTDTNTINGFNYTKAGTYFDDISLKETIDCVAAAEFYNKDGKIATPNDYAAVSLQVGGQPALKAFAGEQATATVNYDKESGAYRFLGWYKNGVKVSAEESVTFTAAAGEVYTPRFASTNILSASASFEGSASGTNLTVTSTANYPSGNLWGSSKNAGYYGATQAGIIYDNNHVPYQQVRNDGTVDSSPSAGRTATVATDKAHSGTQSLKLSDSWYISNMAIENLTPHTDYTLTYYWLSANGQKLTRSAVTTTVNVGRMSNGSTYSITATDGSGKTMTSDALSEMARAGNPIVMSAVESSINKSDGVTWQKVTHTFNSGDFETLYLVLATPGGQYVWIDDLVCTAKTDGTVPVTFENTAGDTINGSSEYASAEILDNFDGTSVATVDYDRESGAYAFKGWYENDALLSEDEAFTFVTGAYDALTAVITSKNILGSSASFEGLVNGQNLLVDVPAEGSPAYPSGNRWGLNVNAGYFGQTKREIITDKNGTEYQQTASGNLRTGFLVPTVVEDAAVAHSGSKYLKLNTGGAPSSLALENLTPGTDYTLSFYWCYDAGNPSDGTLKGCGITTTVNIGNATLSGNAKVTLANAVAAAANPFTVTNNTDVASVAATDTTWRQLTFTFNSGNFETLYLVFAPSDGKTPTVLLDDLVCQAETPALPESITELIGTAIRTTGTQALRYKFSISKDLVNNGVDGYELVEYGSIAIRTAYLGGAALTKDGVYNNGNMNRTPVVGVAYDKEAGKNIIFEETGTDYIFTAALTNIGVNKATGTTNYEAWGYDYSVRNYAVFKNTETGALTTVYDETTAVASVFKVMNKIITQYNEEQPTSGKLYDDYQAIQTILGEAESEQRRAYAAWKVQ